MTAPSITAQAGLCRSHVELVLETRLLVLLNWSQSVTTWDPVQRPGCQSGKVAPQQFEVPAVTPGLDPGTGFSEWSQNRSQDRSWVLRTSPRTGPRSPGSWDQSQDQSQSQHRFWLTASNLKQQNQVSRTQDRSRDRSWESTFCGFGRAPQKLSLIPITSSCIPRRSPLPEAGTGGRGSADLYSLIVCNSMCQWSRGLSPFEIFISGLPDHSCLLHLGLKKPTKKNTSSWGMPPTLPNFSETRDFRPEPEPETLKLEAAETFIYEVLGS